MEINHANARFNKFWDQANYLSSIGSNEGALDCFSRALYLWNGSFSFIEDYLLLCKATKNSKHLQKLSQKAGIYALSKNDLIKALYYFNINLMCFSNLGYGDVYEYDDFIQSSLIAFRPEEKYVYSQDNSKSLRVAILIKGAEDAQSVLVRLALDYAKYFNRERFEINFFSPAPLTITRKQNELMFEEVGAKLTCLNSIDVVKCAEFTIRKMIDFRPDLILSIGALANYAYFYVLSRFTAIKNIAVTFGPPEQYVPFGTDFVVAADDSLLLDAPADGIVIPIQTDSIDYYTLPSDIIRSQLSIPINARVIVSAGRSCKFSDIRLFEDILIIISSNQNCYFLAVGLVGIPNHFPESIKTHSALKQVRFIPWATDYKQFLAISNIYLDTYPSGGGLTLFDAMALGLPVITFENDVSKRFNQSNWNPGCNYVPDQFLIVKRGDSHALKYKLVRLLDDIDLQLKFGNLCKNKVQKERGRPDQMVKQLESVILHVLNLSSLIDNNYIVKNNLSLIVSSTKFPSKNKKFLLMIIGSILRKLIYLRAILLPIIKKLFLDKFKN